jgi:hypothetical protein
MPGMGQEERFPPTRLSVGCGFRKETIAGMRRNGRDAPEADPATPRKSLASFRSAVSKLTVIGGR